MKLSDEDVHTVQLAQLKPKKSSSLKNLIQIVFSNKYKMSLHKNIKKINLLRTPQKLFRNGK